SIYTLVYFFFSSRRRHTRWPRDWSSDVCSSDLVRAHVRGEGRRHASEGHARREHRGAWRREQPSDRRRKMAVRPASIVLAALLRSEERRVGKECRSRGARCELKKKRMGQL